MSETTAVVEENIIAVEGVSDDNQKEDSKPNERKSARITARITAFAALAVSVLILVFMLCGAYQYYRHDVNLLHAVNLILNLFEINKAAVYRTLIGVAISVLYFVTVGFMVRWLVQSIGRCIYVVKTKDGESELLTSMFGNISRCIKSYLVVCGNLIISALVSVAEITGIAIAIMVLVGIMYVAQGLIESLLATPRTEITAIIMNAVKDVLLFTVMCLIVVYLNNAAIMDLIYGLQALFNGNVFSGGVASFFYAQYVFIVEPALWITLSALSFKLVYEFATGSNHFGTKKRVITLMIVIGIALALHLIFKVFLVSASSSFHAYMIGEWLQAVSKTYLPLLLLYVGTFGILKFYNNLNKY